MVVFFAQRAEEMEKTVGAAKIYLEGFVWLEFS
jgi:hypothetical protein